MGGDLRGRRDAGPNRGNGPQVGPPRGDRQRHPPGLTTDERARLKQLERENFELRRANEILRSASLFFATELDGRRKT